MNHNSSDSEKEHLLKTATDFPFQMGEVDLQDCLATVKDLKAAAEEVYRSDDRDWADGENGDSEMGGDEYGSLLYVYEQPKLSTETGPLADHQVGIKDNLAVQGLPMTCGSETLSFTPSYDAVVVERLRNAGATVIGKTNMDAFAFGPSGEFSEQKAVTNPIAPDHVPGGSSSGSGAAVAAELVDVALGTDTGGSVRIPAACCGLVGAKPTHGSVPRHGLVPFAPSLDTVGPLARDVETVAATLETIAGSDPRDLTCHGVGPESATDEIKRTNEPLEIGLAESFFERSDNDVADAVRSTLEDVADQSKINIRSVSIDLKRIEEAYYLIGATEFAWLLRQNSVNRGQGMNYEEDWRQAFVELSVDDSIGAHIAERVLPSAHLDIQTDGKAYVTARREGIEFAQRVAEKFGDVDVLAMPTIRTLPPRLDRITASTGMDDLLGNTAPFNLTGMPAVSLPVTEVDGLPVSVQVAAPRFEDERSLRAARMIEAVTPN